MKIQLSLFILFVAIFSNITATSMSEYIEKKQRENELQMKNQQSLSLEEFNAQSEEKKEELVNLGIEHCVLQQLSDCMKINSNLPERDAASQCYDEFIKTHKKILNRLRESKKEVLGHSD